MADMVVPGIYVAEQQYTLNPLQIDTRCVTGFAGIAERGPLDTPVTLKSFDQYLAVYGGFDTAGVLPISVYNYFKSGGAECSVVRVAGKKSARCAELNLSAHCGALKITAASAGTWGNYLAVTVRHEYEPLSGGVTEMDTEGGEWVRLDTDEIRCGDVLRFTFTGRDFFRTVSAVECGTVRFSRPLKLNAKLKKELASIRVVKSFFCLTVSDKKKTENYLHLSLNPSSERYVETYVNARSKLCSVRADVTEGMIKPVFSSYASGGNDGIADICAGDFIGRYDGPESFGGIGCFESRDDISLIAAPDAQWLLSLAGLSEAEKRQEVYAVQRALVAQAERFGGRFAVLDVPANTDPVGAIEWARSFDSPFAAAYYPAVDVLDPLDPVGAKTIRVPPSGAVCGCIACTDSEKGVFHAPANVALQGAVGASVRITEGEHELLYTAGINVLKYFPGRGVKIWGARTLSSDSEWRYINVRRTFSRITAAVKRGTQWAVFEVNDKNLRKRLVRQVAGFLLDLWMKGYLAGSTSEQGFYVRCDEELNPPEHIDDGILTFEIGLAIVKPAEFFRIMITAEKDGASVYIEN